MVTPAHIAPEWYFLFAYAVLRSIPDKLLGVIALFSSLLVLLVLPYAHTSKIRSMAFRPISKILFWFFVADFVLLTILGAMPVEEPYVLLSQICTVFYFAYFIIITPLVGWLENKLFNL
jgi:ubiquinol-cytochrome c reductase cytochrome b subunit